MCRALIAVTALCLLLPVQADAKVTGSFTGGTVTLTADDTGSHVWISHDEGDVLSIDLGADGALSGCAVESTRFLCAGATSVRFTGGAGDDALTAGEGTEVPIEADGGGGDDHLVGGDMPDILRGGTGKDTVDGDGTKRVQRAGDVLIGGPDDDTIDSRSWNAQELADTVDCGEGHDHFRSDLRVDAATACEEAEPQIVGDFTFSGTPAARATMTLSTPIALGTPTPVVTYEWRACGRYDCSPFATGQTHTFTDAEASHVTRYPVRLEAVAIATNVFGTDVRWAQPEMPPPTGGSGTPLTPSSTPGSTQTGLSSVGPLSTPTSLELAQRVLAGPLVSYPGLTQRSLSAFRHPGTPVLSGGRRVSVFALVCTNGMCQVTLTPSLLLRGRKPRGLARQRFRIMPGTAAVLSVALTRAQRAALKRARKGRVRFAGTLRVGGQNSPLDATISVR